MTTPVPAGRPVKLVTAAPVVELTGKVAPDPSTGSLGLLLGLRHEARALAAFRHPSLVTVHTLGNHRGVDFIVMERTGHFFHRRLMDLRGLLKNGVRDNLPGTTA